MTARQFKSLIQDRIPANYVYISRNIYTVKGVPIYMIYYNSRLPGVKVSKSNIKRQHTSRVKGLFGNRMGDITFEQPLLIDEYSKEIRPNSLIIFTDLAGSYMSKESML